MTVNILSIENLEKSNNFKYQNDPFKAWCKEHQGESFYVLKEDENSLLLKGCYFWISKIYTNYRAVICKQLRDETGLGMMDCKRTLVEFDWNYEKAYSYINEHPEEIPYGFVDYRSSPKWKFISSNDKGENSYEEYNRIEDYLKEQNRWHDLEDLDFSKYSKETPFEEKESSNVVFEFANNVPYSNSPNIFDVYIYKVDNFYRSIIGVTNYFNCNESLIVYKEDFQDKDFAIKETKNILEKFKKDIEEIIKLIN